MKLNLFFALFLLLSLHLGAITHYASPTGVDAYIASTPSTPMSLQYAYFSCAPGDSLLLEGTFTLTQNLYVAITDLYIGEYGSGATLQGNYDNNSAGFPLITLRYPTNVTVENLTFADHFGNGASGILMWGAGDNNTIQNNTFTNIGWNTDPTLIAGSAEGSNAILILGNVNSGSLTNINIVGNAITNCVLGRSEALTIIGNVDGFVIADNYISDVSNIGIDVAGHFTWVADYDTGVSLDPALNQARNGVIRNNSVIRAISPIATSAGLYCDGCKDVVFERNIVKECGAGISIGCEVGGNKTASDVTIINNIFANNQESGMFLGSLASEGSANGPSSVDNCIVRNNTFYQNCQNDGAGTLNDYEVFLQNSNNNEFKNNILYLLNTAKGVVAAGTSSVNSFNMDYNLFYRADQSQLDLIISSATSTLSGNENSQYGEPGFSGIATDLFDISNNGRAANTGDPSTTILAGELDRDGGARIQGEISDIGAQESNSTQSPPAPNTEFAISGFTPDPNKTYYLDIDIDGHRLASNGYSEDAYTVYSDVTGPDVEWKFVAKGNSYWHLQRAAGGSKPRLRTDNTTNADMQATSSSGTYTYFEITENGSTGTYFLTLPDGPNLKRLYINSSADVKMGTSSLTGPRASFTITEVPLFPDPSKSYYIDSQFGQRLASSGSSEDAYVTNTNVSNDDVIWSFVAKGNGYWHLDRTAGGAKPRLRTDNSQFADMQATSSSGSYTYYEPEATGESGGTYYLRLPDGPYNHSSLYISSGGVVKMQDYDCESDRAKFTFTEVDPTAATSAKTNSSNITESSNIDVKQDFAITLEVFPNPAQNQIGIKGLDEGDAVEILSASGQLLIRSIQSQIDISTLNSGMYFVKVQGKALSKFIKN